MKRYILLLLLPIILLIIPTVRAQCDYYINSLPYTISQPGVYCLNKSFFWNGENAINITTSNVVLDFQGHTIISNPEIYTVIYISSNQHNITIKNGYIQTSTSGDIAVAIYIDSGCSNITIYNITIYSDQGTSISTPIYISSVNNLIINNVSISGYGCFSDDIIFSEMSSYVVIENSKISISSVCEYPVSSILLAAGNLNISNTTITCSAGTDECIYGISADNIYANNLTVEGFEYGIEAWLRLTLKNSRINSCKIGIGSVGNSFNIENSRICNNIIDIDFSGALNGSISNSYFDIIYPNSEPITNYPDNNYWCNGTPHSEGDYVNVKVCPTNITQNDVPCNITSPGIYYLDEDINITNTHGERGAIEIHASNVILDCQGHTIYIDNSSDFVYGIGVNNVSNVTIKNCKVIGGRKRNIYITDSKDVYIIDSEIKDARNSVLTEALSATVRRGIEVESENINSTVFIIDSNISGNCKGIYASGKVTEKKFISNITVKNSRICGNSDYDIYSRKTFDINGNQVITGVYEIENSYFDTVYPSTSIIVDYPDHNYYCNDTPRFTANYTLTIITKTFDNVPISGVVIGINGVNYTTNESGELSISLNQNTQVNITVYDTPIFRFSQWNNGSTSRTLTFTIDSNKSLTAIYVPKNTVYINTSTCNWLQYLISRGNVTIYLEKGEYNNSICGNVVISNTRNVKIIGVDKNNVIIHILSTVSIGGLTYNNGWYIENSENITLSNMTIDLQSSGNNGIMIRNSSVSLNNLVIKNINANGITQLDSSKMINITNTYIDNCNIGINVKNATLYNVTSIKSNVNLEVWGYAYINESKFCYHKVTTGYERDIKIFGGTVYLYNSYFDDIDGTEYIVDYPDHNYYCNGTPRFTINYTLTVKTILENNTPIEGITVEINGVNYTTNKYGEVSVLLKQNTEVTLTVYDTPLYKFSHWSNGYTSRTLTFTLDSNKTLTAIYILIPLEIHIIEPKNNSIFNTTTVPVVINATANLSYCNITVNNETYTINANNSKEVRTALTLPWGNYTLSATCKDIYGRTAYDGKIFFTIKKPIKFTIVVVSPKNNSNITGKYVLVKIIGNKNISRCIITIDNNKFVIKPSYTTTVVSKVLELDYGTHTLYAECWSTENEYSSYGIVIFKLVPKVIVPSIIKGAHALIQSPPTRQLTLLLILLGILLIILSLALKKKK